MPQDHPPAPPPPIGQDAGAHDFALLLLLALVGIFLHILVSGRYGFHRDELQTYNNALHLAWGYVEYPPMTPFIGRVELALFGNSLRGFRFFPAVAQGIAMLLAGLAARELGGKREAQLVAALAVMITGPSLFCGSFLSYTSLDYPMWVLAAYLVIRLLKSEDARWWLAIGAAIGVGMMTKYTMGFLVLGVVGGVLLTPDRRYLRSPWLWFGTAVAVLVMLPNVIWQVQHHFVSFEYLKSIHARDIRWGRTKFFLLDQLWASANFVTIPLWCAGLWYLFAAPDAKRYRLLGWMYVVPLVVYVAARARGYYLAPAYPILFAAGAVWGERWVGSLSARAASIVRRVTWRPMVIAGLCTAAVALPVAPLNSAWWRFANGVTGAFGFEIGWPDMVATVAKIRDSLPAQEQAGLGILAGDDGEAGAFSLYGPAYGLPTAISGMNSNWLRGYGDPPPKTVIAVGMGRDFLDRNFGSCELVGRLSNPYGIENQSIGGYADVFVCRNLRQPWPDFWQHFRYYG
jgi:4-amino-4-deoxy-L-arabinose transferase-like glycosyltransferase